VVAAEIPNQRPVAGPLASDRYLSRQAFEQRYGAAYPGAHFSPLGHTHALVWRHGVARL